MFFLLFFLIIPAFCVENIPWAKLTPAKKADDYSLPLFPNLSYFNRKSHEFFEAVQWLWKMFKIDFSKEYKTLREEAERYIIFLKNVILIMEHAEKNSSYVMGINEFSDRSPQEKKYMLGYKSSTGPRPIHSCPQSDIPTAKDWRNDNAVTNVKNQGKCGSCWAFSTTGVLEGHSYLKNKVSVSLSEQQLIDCSSRFGNNGCDGGLMENAFRYIENSGGIQSEEDYPYISGENGTINDQCYFVKSKAVVGVANFVSLKEGDEGELKRCVGSKGPVAVAIHVTDSFMMYKSGIYSEPNCLNSRNDLNHAVLVVGYGTYGGKPYWLVKNSWGTNWGENGYIRMLRGSNNMCGVATAASFPIL